MVAESYELSTLDSFLKGELERKSGIDLEFFLLKIEQTMQVISTLH